MKRTLTLILWLVLTLALSTPPARAQFPPPGSVTLVGTFQRELGCRRDEQVDCEQTALFYDPGDGVWQSVFEIPAGDYTYHAVLNQDRTQIVGADIRLTLATTTAIKFYYDPQTGWLTDNHNTPIATLVGDFQTALGCAYNDDPACLRGWLQDPDGDGVTTFSTTAIPPGDYVVRVALNESSNLWYGAHSMQNGLDIPFAVSETDPRADFSYDAALHQLTVDTAAPLPGDLTLARAHWLSRDTFLWPGMDADDLIFFLHANPEGALRLRADGVAGGRAIELQPGPADPALLARFPHLRGVTLKLPAAALADVPALLKGAVALSAWRTDEAGALTPAAATALQIPGVLDDLFTYRGPLGVTYTDDIPTLRVWAPTAQSVRLHLFADSAPTTLADVYEMQPDPSTGVWNLTGTPDWTYRFYLYEVTIYAPTAGRIVANLVTDPYSLSLARNSARSQIVDLADPALKPPGWDALTPAFSGSPVDMAIYELHVRDFSLNDPTVPDAYRGTFKAFTQADSVGMRHLRALADAGLTHLHLLPVFDIASVNEDKSTWAGPDFAALAGYPPDSEEQQAALAPYRDRDGFNWGYDPLHYTVPEGSYSTDPDGPARIHEFREMVQSLNQNGLGVIMDVVYNHTFASGQNPNSVLDKIVPGYYHRLDADGLVEHSTCCENTATEHAMMEKLMVDSLVTWARAYKVRGFRFDLMGHHMLTNMQAARAALDALTPEQDGVDGRRIYLYGEGWNFGEVADNQQGVNATQINLAGTGIGAFNDRIRDAARGGSAFGGLREQGFITGLYDAPNAQENRSPMEQRARLLTLTDWLRVSLAGGLRDYRLRDMTGTWLTGADVLYNGLPAGYTRAPQETVNYVSAHDNETLFDAVQLKAPDAATVADRARMHNLGIDLVMLAQGVPFFHAGDDLLRSKSLDRNSYNSGDWFNRLDFSTQDNGWGAGLPPADENAPHWPVMRELLGHPALKPAPDDIQAAAAHFQEMLRLRQSSKLFRLETAQDVQERLTFFNTGPEQTPGLLVMALSDAVGADLDPDYELLVVIFNATQADQTFAIDAFRETDFALHPIQAESADPVVRAARYDKAAGAFTVPGRTTAVFATQKAPDIAPAPTPLPSTPPRPTPTSPTPTVTPLPTLTPRPTLATPAPAGLLDLDALRWPFLIGAGLLALLVLILWSRTKD